MNFALRHETDIREEAFRAPRCEIQLVGGSTYVNDGVAVLAEASQVI